MEDERTLFVNLQVFERFNKNKTEFLYQQLSDRQRLVFDLVPFLLHVSATDLLPLTVTWNKCLHGIEGYRISPRIEDSFKKAFPGIKMPIDAPRAGFDECPIKSISLIGSLGSIAQNSKSDFDYWICVDDQARECASLDDFRRKLLAIEAWALDFAGAEVHFFPLRLKNILLDDFGALAGESSGSAQGVLLKEEFYRTMTLVAGQAPLWWLMPSRIDDREYGRLKQLALDSDRIDPLGLVDLGNIRGVSLGELYGAAVWQINKTIGSPFKSVLKLSLLEEYLFGTSGKGLLCDELKERILLSEAEARVLDPYVLMFERASDYLREKKRFQDLDLLRRALYLKTGVQLRPADFFNRDLSRRKKILTGYVKNWNWDQRRLDFLNNYHSWSFEDAAHFSQEINRFVFRTFQRISLEVKNPSQMTALVISPRDLALLKRKLFVFYSRRRNKVDSIRSVIEAPPPLPALTIQQTADKDGQKIWGAYKGMVAREVIAQGEESLLLLSSSYLTELLIWLVKNCLYNHQTSIYLNPGWGDLSCNCTMSDLQSLLNEMTAFFPPIRHRDLKEEAMLKKPRIAKMLVIINLDEPDETRHIQQICLCYQNTWGEVFFKGGVAPYEGLRLARDFFHRLKGRDENEVKSCFRVFLPERNKNKGIILLLDRYFSHKTS